MWCGAFLLLLTLGPLSGPYAQEHNNIDIAEPASRAGHGRDLAKIYVVSVGVHDDRGRGLRTSDFGQTASQCRTIWECHALRWADDAERAAAACTRVGRARDLLDRARRTNPALAPAAEAALRDAEASWASSRRVMEVFASQSYADDLDSRLRDARAELERARQQLRARTDQLRRLVNATGQARDGILRDLDGLSRQMDTQSMTLLLDSSLGTVGVMSRVLGQQIAELKSTPGASLRRIARLESWQAGAKAISRGTTLSRLVNEPDAAKRFWNSLAGLGTEATAYFIEHQMPPLETQPVLNRLAAYPFLLTVGFDFVAIGQTYFQFGEAEQRLSAQLEVEEKWRRHVAEAGARVRALEAETEGLRLQVEAQRTLRARVANLLNDPNCR